jgi:hypothetical protein
LTHDARAIIEQLKPIAFVYHFRDEKPARIDRFIDVSATFKEVDGFAVLTFWYRWDHDWEGDGVEDWEPVTYILDGERVIDIQTRTHWRIVSWLSDDPVLDGKRAILYFSKHGHAPYMQVKANVGWLKKAIDRTLTGYAILDFLEVMDERAGYVEVTDYMVIADREPPSTSRAMTGVNILGKGFFSQCYKLP